MGAVSAQKRSKQRKLSKHNKRKKVQYLRKERALHQVRMLRELLLTTPDMALKRVYVKHIRALSQKVQLKVPFSVKNSYCRRCSEPFTLEPKQTYIVRVRSKPVPMIIYTCLNCGYKRKKLFKKEEDKLEKKKQDHRN